MTATFDMLIELHIELAEELAYRLVFRPQALSEFFRWPVRGVERLGAQLGRDIRIVHRPGGSRWCKSTHPGPRFVAPNGVCDRRHIRELRDPLRRSHPQRTNAV